jgi:hypothetical protein
MPPDQNVHDDFAALQEVIVSLSEIGLPDSEIATYLENQGIDATEEGVRAMRNALQGAQNPQG